MLVNTDKNNSQSFLIFGIKISRADYKDSVNKIISLFSSGKGGLVCVANVSTAMESRRCSGFKNIINSADLVVPDGVPLVWGMRVLGGKKATRVAGTELTLLLCKYAAENNIAVGFYGSTEKVLAPLKNNLKQIFPGLRVDYMFSPPYGTTIHAEAKSTIQEINDSKVKILFVGLGCPKQERWMEIHKKEVIPVMIGVGAAFDFIAKSKKRAPFWMQNCGLEWFYRFLQEPTRLWKRYLIGNLIFAGLVVQEIFQRSQRKCKI